MLGLHITYCCKLNFKQIYESEPVGDVGGRRRCSKKNGFLILFCAHYRSYGARQSSSIISKNRVLRLDERSSVILVGKPIAQTLSRGSSRGRTRSIICRASLTRSAACGRKSRTASISREIFAVC